MVIFGQLETELLEGLAISRIQRKRPAPVVPVGGPLRIDPDYGIYDVDTFATRVSRFASICRAKRQQPRNVESDRVLPAKMEEHVVDMA